VEWWGGNTEGSRRQCSACLVRRTCEKCHQSSFYHEVGLGMETAIGMWQPWCCVVVIGH
jgi:hypothetical protein